MGRSSDTKHRILAEERIFIKRREITLRQLADELERNYNIKCNRKTLYDDINVSTAFIPIFTRGAACGHTYIYNPDWMNDQRSEEP